MFNTNCREYSKFCLYKTNGYGKTLWYKGLRQAGLIITEWDFDFGVCLSISGSEFHLGVSSLGSVYC